MAQLFSLGIITFMATLQNDFFGELTYKDDTGFRKSLFIRVCKNTYDERLIRLYNTPPSQTQSWEISWVGDIGDAFRIKRIKRGFLLSTFLLSKPEEKIDIECLAGNKFADMLVQALG